MWYVTDNHSWHNGFNLIGLDVFFFFFRKNLNPLGFFPEFVGLTDFFLDLHLNKLIK